MKSASAGMLTHLAGEITTLAICWKLALTNGTILGFTDHIADLVVGGVTYKAATGISPTSIANSAQFAVDNLDVQGILDSSAITEADIMAGKYDFAEILIFTVNVNDLTQGTIIHRRGWLGEVSLRNSQFTAEVRGLSQKLQQNIGEIFSPSCRAVLGDARCKVNLAGFTFTGTVTAITSRQIFIASAFTQAAAYFSGGEVQWTGGANTGRRMEVKEFANGQFTLALPMVDTVQIGDTLSAIAGCDKSFGTCFGKFSNAVNFRGEPYVPGMDKMLATAATANDLEQA